MNDQLSFLESSEFPKNEFIEVDSSLYDGVRFLVKDTTFIVFVRKNSAIGIERFHKAINLAWPKWLSFFPIKSQPITILETDWGLGGGSLGPFILAIHLKDDYDEASAKYLESILDWPAQSTGSAYINKYYADFEDPLQAYVTDKIVHELGHIFFLHGITDLKNEDDVWFALGMGLVYDRLIWDEVSNIPSPTLKAYNHIWKTKFANNPEIDQCLINPNTDNDEKFGLVRLQIYSHARAHAYLSSLRIRIGKSKFDNYVKTYLSRPLGSPIEYDDFLTNFSNDDLKIVRHAESEFSVR